MTGTGTNDRLGRLNIRHYMMPVKSLFVMMLLITTKNFLEAGLRSHTTILASIDERPHGIVTDQERTRRVLGVRWS